MPGQHLHQGVHWGGCWRSQVSSCTAKLLCAYPGIDSAQPASASTQQAFSFGFAANSDSAAPEDAQAEEPGNASIPQADSSTPEEPEATVVAAAQPQRPPAQQLQVSAHSCEAYHAYAMHRGCVAPGLALLICLQWDAHDRACMVFCGGRGLDQLKSLMSIASSGVCRG